MRVVVSRWIDMERRAKERGEDAGAGGMKGAWVVVGGGVSDCKWAMARRQAGCSVDVQLWYQLCILSSSSLSLRLSLCVPRTGTHTSDAAPTPGRAAASQPTSTQGPNSVTYSGAGLLGLLT